MNKFLRRNSDALRRVLALAVAALCLWMATGGVLRHTDDLQFGASSSARVVWSQSTTAIPTADLCAACEWLAGALSAAIVVFVLLHPLFILISQVSALVRFQPRRSPSDCSTRGPPFPVLAAC